MSRTSTTNTEGFTYEGLNRRTVAAIQKETVKMGERNMASQLLHKKEDKDMIAGWKQDLVRILHIINVRLAGPTR